MSIVIADAGSTKIHWMETGSGGNVKREFFTTGVNPMVMSAEAVAAIFDRELAGRFGPEVERIEYYGAGCRGEEPCDAVRRALAPHARGAAVEVESDMLGACRCLIGRSGTGVVCILGTGANSCLYIKGEIVANVSPGGYILGDEGSGAWIGRRLASDYIKGLLPGELAMEFHRDTGLDAAEIIRRVYRPGKGEDAPNRFLASLAPFVSAHIAEPSMKGLAECGFREFFNRNVALYFHECATRNMKVNFTGSVAKAFEPLLRATASGLGYEIGIVAKSPIAAVTGSAAASE